MIEFYKVSRNIAYKVCAKTFWRELKTTLRNINYYLHMVEIAFLLCGRFNIENI